MRHVTAAAIRKRGRRRVADENRKRAVRAYEFPHANLRVRERLG